MKQICNKLYLNLFDHRKTYFVKSSTLNYVISLISNRFCVGDKFYLCDNKILCQYDYDEMSAFAASINHELPTKRDVKLSRFIGQQENVPFLNTLPNNKRPSPTNDYNNNHNKIMKHMKHAISSNWNQRID